MAVGGTSPDYSTVGTLNTGNLTLNNRSTLDAQVNAGSHDEVFVTGTVTISSTAFLNAYGTVTTAAEVTLIHNTTPATPVAANLSLPVGTALTEGATVTINGVNFQISYKGNGGSDVILGANTTVGASSSSLGSSAVYGGSLYFTATITSGTTGVPIGGTVQFYVDGTGSANLFDTETVSANPFSGSLSVNSINVTAASWPIAHLLSAGTHTIYVQYSGDGTFSPASGSMSQIVTPAPITVTAATSTKTYDGTTSSAATPTLTSGSLVYGDTAVWTETYDTKNVGNGKTLTAAGSISDGNGGNNYTVTFATNTTGQITVEAITVTAAASTKTYDGTTSSPAMPTLTSGSLMSGDTLAFSESFDSKNAGTGKTLTAAGSVNDGNSGNNYSVSFTANTAGQITVEAITVTAAASTKVYDGTTSSPATPTITSGSLIGGDTLAFSESFDTKNAGTGKTLTAAGSVGDGNSGHNYSVTFAANTTGQITVEAITVTAAASTKVYDGTTSSPATPTITSGSLGSGDTAAFSESFDTRNAGTGKTLTAAGSVNDGNSGHNYSVTFAANTAGQITAEAITVTAFTSTKGYDGTTSTAVTPTITGGSLVSGDTAAFSETFDTRNAGTGKTLTAAGSVNDGNGGADYSVTFATNATGQITARAITVTAAPNSKTYDGTTSAAATPTLTAGSLVGSDTLAFSESYDSKNVGTGKTLAAAGSVSDGDGGNDYAVTLLANTAGAIAVRAITVTATAYGKVYDGSTSAAALPTITSGSLAPGDTAAWSESYDNSTGSGKNVGINKTLDAAGSVNDGNNGNNYTVTFAVNTAGAIGQRPITVTAATNTKGYDGSTSASATPTVTSGSLVGTDTLAFSETYPNKNVGTGLLLTPAGSVSDGNGGDNYAVTLATNATGQITARAITVTAANNLKTYDGSASAAATPTVTGGTLASGDTGVFTEYYYNGASVDVNVDADELVPTGLVNDGNSGNNYSMQFVPILDGVAGGVAEIAQKNITVTAVANSKVYEGGTSAAATPTITGGSLVSGQVATWSESYDNRNTGTGKTLTPTGAVVDGFSGGDYRVKFLPSTAGIVSKLPIQVFASPNTKIWDGTVTAAATPTITVGSLASGDTAAFSETYDNANVGTGKTLTPAGSVNDGNGGNNYVYSWADNYTGVITASIVVASFSVTTTPTTIVAGNSLIIFVTALDNQGNTVTSFSGTVQLASDDSEPGVPSSLALTDGFGYTLASLTKAGTRYVTASATLTPPVPTATSNPITVTPALASQVVFSQQPPSSESAGGTFSAVASVEDQYGNVVSTPASTNIASGTSGAKESGSTVTVTTTTADNLAAGEQVTVSGVGTTAAIVASPVGARSPAAP